MAAGKKNGILALVAGAPDDKGEDDADGMEPSTGSAEQMAAEDMLSAIKSGDAGALVSAYRRLKSACEMGGGEEADEGDETDGAYGA